jgi:hypothetical protein
VWAAVVTAALSRQLVDWHMLRQDVLLMHNPTAFLLLLL